MNKTRSPVTGSYDASDGVYYDALPSANIPWQNGDFFNQIETLSAE